MFQSGLNFLWFCCQSEAIHTVNFTVSWAYWFVKFVCFDYFHSSCVCARMWVKQIKVSAHAFHSAFYRPAKFIQIDTLTLVLYAHWLNRTLLSEHHTNVFAVLFIYFVVNVIRYGYSSDAVDVCMRNVILQPKRYRTCGAATAKREEYRHTHWKEDNMMHTFRANEMVQCVCMHDDERSYAWLLILHNPANATSKRIEAQTRQLVNLNYNCAHRFDSLQSYLYPLFTTVRPLSLRRARKHNQICLPPKKKKKKEIKKETTTTTTTTKTTRQVEH